MTCSQTRVWPAVFLDRDGTLIEDRGYLRNPDEVVFYPETAAALRRLQEGFRLFIVTNQSGISKGLATADEVDRVNRHVVDVLRKEGVRIEAVYCCPHQRSEQCACIKPNPFFLEQAQRDYGIDLANSFTVGDHPHDVDFAEPVGATGIYLLTGHGQKHRADLPGGKIALDGIRAAADWMLGTAFMREQERFRPGLMDKATHLLNHGGVVAMPTETVYGLGANAFDPLAVARIFEIKQRPQFDPLIVHIAAHEQLALLTNTIPAAAQTLIEQFWPGPLTLVLPKSFRVPDLVTSDLPSVAVRMPRHPLALELLRRAGVPIAAPSANPFGLTSPTTARHVIEQLGDKVDLVIDGGPCSVGVESTIVSFIDDAPTLLRAGGVAVEDIEHVIGPVKRMLRSSDRPSAPGQLSRHYSPRTPLFLDQTPETLANTTKAGLLALRPPENQHGFAAVEVLSASGDLREAAANLFAAMHTLDAMNLDCIYAESVPDTGLGLAINDRLRRAAHRDAEVQP